MKSNHINFSKLHFGDAIKHFFYSFNQPQWRRVQNNLNDLSAQIDIGNMLPSGSSSEWKSHKKRNYGFIGVTKHKMRLHYYFSLSCNSEMCDVCSHPQYVHKRQKIHSSFHIHLTFSLCQSVKIKTTTPCSICESKSIFCNVTIAKSHTLCFCK